VIRFHLICDRRPMIPVSLETSWPESRSQALALELLCALATHLGLGRKARSTSGPLRPCDARWQTRISGFSVKVRAGLRSSILDLLAAGLRQPPVQRPRRPIRRNHQAGPAPRPPAFGCAVSNGQSDPGGSGILTGPEIRVTAAPAAAADARWPDPLCRKIDWRCSARIDRIVGGSRCNQHPPAT